MSQKIDLDHGRFRQIIRGKIKQNLRKYISQGEMIAKKGKDTVAIPLPSVDIPHFKHGDKQQGGVGQGSGEVGDSLGQDGEEQPGAGQAGDRPGDHLMDIEISIQELAEIMGEELRQRVVELHGHRAFAQRIAHYDLTSPRAKIDATKLRTSVALTSS